jgi:hypothetical protein
MKELTEYEEKIINGGAVPQAYYMDNDVIKAVGHSFKAWLKAAGETLTGLFH